MKIFIIGLRRSGTTIFWRTFRQDRRFICYDEPFNPLLKELPSDNYKRTRREFIELLNRDTSFFKIFTPIYPEEEYKNNFSSGQLRYLKYIVNTYTNITADFTRCNFKLNSLRLLSENIFLIHLHRQPINWVTSNLLPHGRKRNYSKIANWLRKPNFWYKKKNYNFWDYETIINSSIGSIYENYVKKIGIEFSEFMKFPAFAKLLLFWFISFDRVEKSRTRYWKNKSMQISFEDFCGQPNTYLNYIYNNIKFSKPKKFDVSKIHRPNIGFNINSDRWKIYLDKYKMIFPNIERIREELRF